MQRELSSVVAGEELAAVVAFPSAFVPRLVLQAIEQIRFQSTI